MSTDPVARKRMGEAARQRVIENFSIETMLEKTFAVYDEVMKEKDGRS